MRGHRLTITAIVASLTMLALVPAAALAGPLLSGYGGPGQGNQAILGSGLVGGRGGDGSGGHGSSPGAAGSAGHEGSVASAAASVGAGGSNSSSGTATAKGRHPQAAGSTRAAVRSHPGERTPGLPRRAAATGAAAGGGGALGLSGADVVYILLALGALVVTGALTRVLARQPG
jgi:hypothetical protein